MWAWLEEAERRQAALALNGGAPTFRRKHLVHLNSEPLSSHVFGEFRRLTFDMRGAQKAQPFGHPLDGRVRP